MNNIDVYQIQQKGYIGLKKKLSYINTELFKYNTAVLLIRE